MLRVSYGASQKKAKKVGQLVAKKLSLKICAGTVLQWPEFRREAGNFVEGKIKILFAKNFVEGKIKILDEGKCMFFCIQRLKSIFLEILS